AEVKPQLISLDINSQFLDYRNMYNSLRKDIQFSEMIPFANVPKDLELNYRQNHLTFFYDANDWAAADMIRFSYRLKGEEENWSEPTPETMVDYRNLSHGTYTFQLCAIGQGREWSAPLEYTFTVLPPLWLTWYAWGSYILLILLGLYQYRSYLLRNATRKADARLKLMEADKIRELDEHKTHFFTNITHEFRTPLSLISGTIQSLKKPGIPLEERETNIDLLSRNSQRLTKLVNNLLELTKLEESRMKVELKKCDLISEIKYHMAAFQSVAQSRNITFKISAPEEQVIAYSDTEKLEIILYNLLSNAFKYVDEYGKIGLEVKTGNAHNLEIKSGNSGYQGEYISIAVNDDGPGIAPDKLEKIFDRFEKDLSAVQYSEGMGIGLALAKELVQFLNGSIEVKSKVNEGTTVLVYIPIEKEGFDNVSSIDEEVIERDADLTETVDTDGIEKEQESLLTTGQKIVLIAEDNEDLRTYLRQELTSDFKLLMTENGRIAWDQCLEYLPDLIITDLMMPEMDGIELCKKVKEHELTSHIPVIMLTAKSGSENRIEGHKSGADDYIQKPFNIEELRIKMQNMILQREKLKEKFSINSIFTETDSSGENVNAEFLRRLSETLEENLTNTQLTPEFLAENMNMSRSQLYRKHKAVTGESVSAFIRDYRLSRAEQLLRHNSANVTEVAYMCGFQTPSYFTTAFSKRYGVSPLSYLKKYNS
ncbi:MAG: hybrid sensor histidine kinase/response regulator transcription factor, partial [Bacteroidota bacterium]